MSQSRSKLKQPAYRRQKKHGRQDQAFVVLNGKRHWLGVYDSPESWDRYQQLMAEWWTSRGDPPPPPDQITIIELLARWLKAMEKRYQDRHGNPTTSLRNARYAVRWLRDLFGYTPANEFGPARLKAVQQAMAEAGLAASYVNKNINTIRKVFKWAAGEELVAPEVPRNISRDVVEGVRAHIDAKGTADVKPVSAGHVDAVLPRLTSPVAAMIKLQRYTGCRPGEVVRMRPSELDTMGDVWTYVPQDHKRAHAESDRTIFIGPKGQAVLADWLTANRPLHKPIFSPTEAEPRRCRPGVRNEPRPTRAGIHRAPTGRISGRLNPATATPWRPIDVRFTAAAPRLAYRSEARTS